MEPIKFILSFCILCLATYTYRKLKISVTKKISLFIGSTLCILIVFHPGITTAAAEYMGVHRGVDLLFYFGFLLMLFLVVKLYKKIRSLEKSYTQIVRSKAIETAKNNADKNNG